MGWFCFFMRYFLNFNVLEKKKTSAIVVFSQEDVNHILDSSVDGGKGRGQSLDRIATFQTSKCCERVTGKVC